MRTLELPDVTAWTPQDLEGLSTEFRYEVREGNLVVMTAAMRPWHADVQARVRNLLVHTGHQAYIRQGVVLPGQEIRTCDVGVYSSPPQDGRAYHPASEFTLLVEVVSETSRREDRGIKPRVYADAGVPEYWRVEEGDDGEAVVYQYHLAHLTDGPSTYVEHRLVALDTLESE